MSPKLCLRVMLAIACLSATAATMAGEFPPAIPPKLPVEDFSRFKIVGGVSLSPDGKTMAYEISQGEDWMLVFHDWETGNLVTVKRGANGGTPVWLGTERVVYGYGSSVDRSGNNGRYDRYAGVLPWIIFSRFPGDKSNAFLASSGGEGNVFYIDTRNDIGSTLVRVQNPGGYFHWTADGTGFVRVAQELEKTGVRTRVVVRDDEKSPWLVPQGLDFAKEKVRVHWLSADGKLLYISLITPDGMWGVYSYDLERQKVKELILSHTKYDIYPAAGATLAPKTREILGFDYVTDKQRTIWFDPQMSAVQGALDQILPDRINTITSLSDDLQRMIIFSTSARDPGTYYRFDLAKKQLRPLMPILPWIKPAQMADDRPITYQSRDGLTIHGYLTVPQGRDPKNLPLVVLPHADLWGRDTWGYLLDVQFLANRGYAVLRMNYRGSTGYGQAFREKAFRRIGHEVLDDITDGTRWAIEQGIADPNRIAIMGYYFGGYAALRGIEQTPQLYRCAISISGLTNLAIRKKDLANAESFKEYFGDAEKDIDELKDISPVSHVSDVKGPLLLIYDADEDNYLALRDDFKAFTSALDKAHKPYETIDKHNEFSGITSRKGRVAVLDRIDKFLTKNMPSDMANTGANVGEVTR